MPQDNNAIENTFPGAKVGRTRIKICGMTRVDDVEHAINQGVDAIGMILHANSPRTINLSQAAKIREVVPAFVSLVGVFVNADQAFIEQAIDQTGIDLVQLHGDETELDGSQLSKPYIKAIRAKSAEQVALDCTQFPSARAILLDPYVAGQHGGTGRALSFDHWPQRSEAEIEAQPLILAGGLSPENVASRIEALRPYAVDLNSGLEVSPGIKDSSLVVKAVKEIQRADYSCD